MNDSRVVTIIVAVWRGIADFWRRLGDVDRALDRSRVQPDCAYDTATALVADSAITRTIVKLYDGWHPDGSVAVATAAAIARRVHQLARWQTVRLVGVVFTTALIVHAALCAVLPWRFGPRLPVLVWIAVAAIGTTMIVAAREFVAAWDQWRH